MNRYIDEISARENFQDVLAYMGSEVKRMLKKIPTADVVEVRHGQWGFDGFGWTCSECDEYAILGIEKLNYCPRCGAKMDGERREG